MVCIAITRSGFGTVLRFENSRAAYLHPVVQYGDAIAPTPEDLVTEYNKLEWPRLMKIAGVEDRIMEDALLTLSFIEERAARTRSAPRIFDHLTRIAADPPDTLEGIVAMVAADRVSQEKRDMTVENTSAEKAPRAVSTGNLNPKTRIRLGADKEGKKYSATHTPYKPDSNREGRFLKLKNGMTVEKASEAGVAPRYLEDMAERGFIKLIPPSDAKSDESEAGADEGEADAGVDEIVEQTEGVAA